MGTLLLLIYTSDWSTVSETYLSLSFAYDINVFIIGRNIDAICQQLNDDLEKNRVVTQQKKISLNIEITHCMFVAPHNKFVHFADMKICNENIS